MNIPISVVIDAFSTLEAAAKLGHAINASVSAHSTVSPVVKAHYVGHTSITGTALTTGVSRAHYKGQATSTGLSVCTPGTPLVIENLVSSLTAGSIFGAIFTVTSRIPNTPRQNVPIPIVRTVPQPPPILNLQIANTGQVKNPPLQTGVRVKIG